MEVEELGAYLAWSNLTVSVSRRNATNTLIDGLTGYAEPATITALMGPSSSGKSTLLDTLAGRLSKNARQTGHVLLNGRRQTLAYGKAAYVTQDDTLLGTLTVLETVTFSAFFRLPDSMLRKEKIKIVDSVINDMGLRDAVHTAVGNWHLKGLSFGYFITDDEFQFILWAMEFIADKGQRFLPLYDFDWYTGEWTLKRTGLNKLTMPLPISCPTSSVESPRCAEESGFLQLRGNEIDSIYEELGAAESESLRLRGI